MRNIIPPIFLLALMPLTTHAQFFGTGPIVNQDSLNRATLADYENMKAQIGVTETRIHFCGSGIGTRTVG